MIRKNPQGDLPEIHPTAFVDPTAIICGRVVVEENVFIGPYAVIRADERKADGGIDPITIGAHSNIQDGVVIHSKSGACKKSVAETVSSPWYARIRRRVLPPENETGPVLCLSYDGHVFPLLRAW